MKARRPKGTGKGSEFSERLTSGNEPGGGLGVRSPALPHPPLEWRNIHDLPYR